MKKRKGLRSTNRLLQKNYGNEKYSIESMVSDIPVTLSDGCQVYWYDHLVSYAMSNYWGVYLKLI